MKHRQRGITAVEFAVVGPVALLVLLGCIEVGRLLFICNTVAEATRRGARVATVVTPDAAGLTTIQNAVTSFGSAAHVATANVTVQYYDGTGTLLATPSVSTTQYVSVSVSNVTFSIFFGLLRTNFTVPAFTTTLPVESMGVNPA